MADRSSGGIWISFVFPVFSVFIQRLSTSHIVFVKGNNVEHCSNLRPIRGAVLSEIQLPLQCWDVAFHEAG